MALGNIVIYFFTALVTVSFIYAENDSTMDLYENQMFIDEILEEFEAYSKMQQNVARNKRDLNINLGYFGAKKCNFTKFERGICSSCTEAMFCFPFNIGITRNCGLLNRPCNNGHCSLRNDTECAQQLAAGNAGEE